MTTDIKALEHQMKEHGVRPSPVRLLILRTLSDAEAPISALEIENMLETVDRSSITRTLAAFDEAGLIHAIVDGSGAAKYEVCHSSDTDSDTDEHLHFRCRVCGRTICLNDIPVPEVSLPDGFKAEKYNFVIVGVCDKCKDKE